MSAINSVLEDQGEFVEAFRENVIRVMGNYSKKNETTVYDEQIDKLQGTMMSLIEENAKQGSYSEQFDEEYKRISDEIKEVKEQKNEMLQNMELADKQKQRIEEVDDYLKQSEFTLQEFDEELVRRLLQSIKVMNKEKLQIQFKSGIVMEQRI